MAIPLHRDLAPYFAVSSAFGTALGIAWLLFGPEEDRIILGAVTLLGLVSSWRYGLAYRRAKRQGSQEVPPSTFVRRFREWQG